MTTLADVRDGAADGVDLLAVRSRKELLSEMQTRLGALALLDPPADGDFGPVSTWAWHEFCSSQGDADPRRLTPALAGALLSLDAQALFPLDAARDGLAGRVLRSMAALDYWICRHPLAFNIVYVEGHDADGNRNTDAVDAFNDLRLLVRIDDGRARIAGAWEATTQSGWHWILQPTDDIRDPVKAAAHIALGQYKAWCIGTHTGASIAHEALVQRARIRVHRDRNKDGRRDGDPVFERPDYAINQHHASDAKKVGRYSAGCLVGRSSAGHRDFLAMLKSDPRYRASNSHRFLTAVIGSDQLLP